MNVALGAIYKNYRRNRNDSILVFQGVELGNYQNDKFLVLTGNNANKSFNVISEERKLIKEEYVVFSIDLPKKMCSNEYSAVDIIDELNNKLARRLYLGHLGSYCEVTDEEETIIWLKSYGAYDYNEYEKPKKIIMMR